MTLNGTRIVNYSAYKMDDLDNPLDMSQCKNKFIFLNLTKNNDILETFGNLERFKNWFKYFKEGKDIFDLNSPFYNDHCYSLSENSDYDIIL